MSKNRRAIAAALLLACGFFCGIVSAAEFFPGSPSPFVTDVWKTADKLPDDTVVSVIQSHDGYLWVGTLHGLARFDGLNFTPFDNKDFAGSRILGLFEDSQTNLWVCTDNKGIWVFRRNGEYRRFSLGPGNAGGTRTSVTEDENGSVWMRLDNGVVGRYWSNKLERVNGQFNFAVAEKNGPVWLAFDAELIPVVAPPGAGAMLVQQDAQVSVSDLQFLAASKTGGVWRFANGRIEKWKNNRRERDLGPYPWDKQVMAACEDDRGNLIVGTYGDGVYWFDEKGKYTHILSELTHGYVLCLTFDSDGNLWVGTNGRGLNRLRRNPFSVVANSWDKVVQSVSPDQRGGVWIGYNGNLVEHWNGSNSRTYPIVTNAAVVEGTYAKSVFVDRDERILAGIFFQSFLGPRLFQFETNRFGLVNPGIGANISAIHQDRTGRIWIGTQSGLVLLNGNGSKVFSVPEGLPSLDIHAIADDAAGNLWVGTSEGLACLRDGKVTSYQKENDLAGSDISALLADSDGVLWVGTRGSGLGRLAANHWTFYTTHEGLGGDSIGYLLEDNETNLWIGSNSGLMRVAKKSLNDFANGTDTSIQCRTYIEDDGLPTRECTEGSQPAACATADGKLWFPTARGLVYVNPSALKRNMLEPPVIIESVLVDSVRQGTNVFGGSSSEIIVPPGKHNLEIHYASLNLGAADRSRFQYRLKEQQDVSWIDANGNRTANFAKLLPGAYQFQVKACNEDGVWSSHWAQLTVVVQPALWQKAWFRVLIAAVLLWLIAGLVYYFSTQKLQRQVQFLRQQEALEHERGRIARDLHDQLGANLTQVALLAEMAESDKNLPDEVEDHAKQISLTARETTKALDEIVWAVNPSNDTLEGLVNYAGKYAQEYFALAGLRYRVDIPSELPDITLPPEVRHNVFLAFKESVNNVVKHAQATEAHVRLRLEPGSFTLEIEDNGKGPAGTEQKTGRNGLRNMRKRMEDVGGSFTLSPAPEKGSLVRLSAPIRNRTHAH